MSPMTTDPPRITTAPDLLADLYATTGDRAALRRALIAQEGRRRATRLWAAARKIADRHVQEAAEAASPAPLVNRGGRRRIGAPAPSGTGSAAMNTTVDPDRLAAVDAYRRLRGVSRNEVMRRAMRAALDRPPRAGDLTGDRYPRRVVGTSVVWIPDPADRARFAQLVAAVTPAGQAGRGVVGALMRYGLDRLFLDRLLDQE